jgi:hypothetical protein
MSQVTKGFNIELNQFSVSLESIYQYIIKFFEHIDIRILIFVLLCLNFLSFIPSDNEESYLPLARQFIDPGWIPNSFTFTEWPSNRLIFQFITGWFLKFLTFEQMVFWGRMVIFLAIAFPVGSLFKSLNIRNITALILLQCYLMKQTYFAGEFIFGDYEAKSVAYIMVFAGLYFLLKDRFIMAAFFAVLAGYLHILVGGWFFLVLIIYTYFRSGNIILPLKQLLLFIVLIFPYGLFMAKTVISTGSVIHGVNIDWVYVFFRNPHHAAPFTVRHLFFNNLAAIVVMSILFLLTIFSFRSIRNTMLDKLRLLNIIIFSVLFVSLIISLLPHTEFLLKFYMFRLAALGLFLMYLYVALIFQNGTINISPAFKMLFLVLGICLIISASFRTYKKLFNPPLKPAFSELVSYVNNNIKPDDVILTLDDYDISLSRKTRREIFVTFKFDPGGGEKIYEWYQRVLERNRIRNDINNLDATLKKYQLSYVLSDKSLPSYSRIKLCFHNSKYYLYKIQ